MTRSSGCWRRRSRPPPPHWECQKRKVCAASCPLAPNPPGTQPPQYPGCWVARHLSGRERGEALRDVWGVQASHLETFVSWVRIFVHGSRAVSCLRLAFHSPRGVCCGVPPVLGCLYTALVPQRQACHQHLARLLGCYRTCPATRACDMSPVATTRHSTLSFVTWNHPSKWRDTSPLPPAAFFSKFTALQTTRKLSPVS